MFQSLGWLGKWIKGKHSKRDLMAHNFLSLHPTKGFLYILSTRSGSWLWQAGLLTVVILWVQWTVTHPWPHTLHTLNIWVCLYSRGRTARLISRQDLNILTTVIAVLCWRFFSYDVARTRSHISQISTYVLTWRISISYCLKRKVGIEKKKKLCYILNLKAQMLSWSIK